MFYNNLCYITDNFLTIIFKGENNKLNFQNDEMGENSGDPKRNIFNKYKDPVHIISFNPQTQFGGAVKVHKNLIKNTLESTGDHAGMMTEISTVSFHQVNNPLSNSRSIWGGWKFPNVAGGKPIIAF